MTWYEEAVFYHIYPLGLTGAPKQNNYESPVCRLKELKDWIGHIKNIGCNAIYIGPLFQSVGHGYETTDYRLLDSRLGENKDLTEFVADCHNEGIKVILDGVFNHTGRDFFAFLDIKKNRENSVYKDWYCNVNFYGNTEYNDGFSYENWGGYNLLVKLNQKNPQVKEYIADVVRFWVKEFDIDGIRLDAADVLDFSYMQMLRQVAEEVKPDFWLMGEVIHGDYNKWANEGTLHSVTNYQLHKALYSGHNDHNYFEIAHTVKRLNDMFKNGNVKLYNFVDNHDVERIYTKLQNKDHFVPVHILLYTLPGIPSLYYGSEFGIEGRKERGSDDSLRPRLELKEWIKNETYVGLITRLGKLRNQYKAFAYGSFEELCLTNRQYAFVRRWKGQSLYTAVNNDENPVNLTLPVEKSGKYQGLLSGEIVEAEEGRLFVTLPACQGEVWIELGQQEGDPVLSLTERKPEKNQKDDEEKQAFDSSVREKEESKEISDTEEKEETALEGKKAEEKTAQKTEGTKGGSEWVEIDHSKRYEEMSIEELQAVIYEKMRKNGPVTERMKQDIIENIYHNSLVTWAKSF